MSNADRNKSAEAVNLLHEQVLVPAFFDRLAEHGAAPTTQKEASQLLRIGHRLMQAEQQSQLKQAEDHSDVLSKVASYLDQALGQAPPVTSAAEAHYIKQATDHFVADEALVAAALTLQDAVAQAHVQR